MKRDEVMKKYLDGETSLEEEKELFHSTNEDAWAEHLSQSKKAAPEGLEDSIWENIQSKRQQKQQFIYGLTAAAASVVMVMSFIFFNNTNDTEMSLSQKEQMLQEALSMFPEEKPANKEVLYSDELIEIYVATN
ncbi:MAG: hypothetical protein CMB80_07085 [Flammeovirgaceae bacterium]|nr:hypothetical protein [Flammeovirgaceae bacterium]MBE62951.1 hypothetical protein [Flammeovirgaceae bacterium]HCX20794.1 hypothetical protein [Cytophagales bacterium]|tara:strand:+ start:7927 stop:8328 length:402 start_codon:yes stop_codon:yes gene_type:complete